MESRYYKSDLVLTLKNIPDNYDYFVAIVTDSEGHTIAVGDDPNNHSGVVLSQTSYMTIEGAVATMFLNDHNFSVGVVLCQLKIGRILDGEIYDSFTGKFPLCVLYDERKPKPGDYRREHLERVNYENRGIDPAVPYKYSTDLLIATLRAMGTIVVSNINKLRALTIKNSVKYTLCIETKKLYVYNPESTHQDDDDDYIKPDGSEGRWESVFSFVESGITQSDINNWNQAYNNAEKNVIESITVNGVPVPISGKIAAITVSNVVSWDNVSNKPQTLVYEDDLSQFIRSLTMGGTSMLPDENGDIEIPLPIVTIKVNNSALPITNKTVNIDLSSYLSGMTFNGASASVVAGVANINYTPKVGELNADEVEPYQESSIADPDRFILYTKINGEWKSVTLAKLKELINSIA